MNKKCILILLIMASIYIFNCCVKSTDSISESKFRIKVDSLNVPDSIAFNDTLICKFWALIGSNLCYQFSNFETKLNPKQIDIKLWGYHTESEVCATAVSVLRGKEYKFIPEAKGLFQINVFQPDNSILKDSVLVN